MKRTSRLQLVMLTIVIIFTVAACAANDETSSDGGNNNNNNNGALNLNNENSNNNEDMEAVDQEEVTITWANGWGLEGNVEMFKEPIEEALPHITVEIIEEEDVEQLIASQSIPDIFYGTFDVNELKEFEVAYDLDPFLDQYNFDFTRIDPAILEEARNSDDGLYRIPINRAIISTYYNKDIFDVFGVNYPEDMMTWDDAINLAAEVTGEADGAHYVGLDINMPAVMLDQREITHIDPETHEVTYETNEDFRTYLGKLERLWSIPGIFPPDVEPEEYLFSWGNNFFGELNVAMTINWDAFGWANGVEGLNWDIVTMPVWEDAPTTGGWGAGFYFNPSAPAVEEKGDAIYEIIDFLTSPEYQEWASRTDGRATILDDPAIQNTLAADMDGFDDINLESAFMLEPNPGIPQADLSPYAHRYETMWEDVAEFASLDTDINTFLREQTEKTEEQIRQGIGMGEVEAKGVWAE